MPITLSSAEASLRTLSVTIQALTVSNKQMTLAVFRQLPDRPICDYDGKLCPELKLWGTVRYKIEDELDWVVAEWNNNLYRCPWPTVPTSELNMAQRELRTWLDLVNRYNPPERSVGFQINHLYANLEFIWTYNARWAPENCIPIEEGKDYLLKEIAKREAVLKKKTQTVTNVKALQVTLSTLPQLFIAV